MKWRTSNGNIKQNKGEENQIISLGGKKRIIEGLELSHVEFLSPTILVLWKLRQENCFKCKALTFGVRSCQKTKTKMLGRSRQIFEVSLFYNSSSWTVLATQKTLPRKAKQQFKKKKEKERNRKKRDRTKILVIMVVCVRDHVITAVKVSSICAARKAWGATL